MNVFGAENWALDVGISHVLEDVAKVVDVGVADELEGYFHCCSTLDPATIPCHQSFSASLMSGHLRRHRSSRRLLCVKPSYIILPQYESSASW